MRWLERRAESRPRIYGIQTCDLAQLNGDQIASESNVVIFDLPAAIPNERLHHYTYIADSILIPIMPSAIDVYSATRFIAELLLDQQLDRREQKLAIVANRVRSNTKSYRMLQRFLSSLRIPMIAELRDSQIYVQAVAQGIGLCEMPAYIAKRDIQQIHAIQAWLHKRSALVREALSEQQRQTLISQAAYRRAENRGFQGGDPKTDWLEAELEVESAFGDEPY